ncbi:phosphomevalonate kinase [Cellulomonas triticagri]|uniref:phosphomevalonate kinase n=1 Tax=Cellulomonas triticagri TaxID=2483352 RepID=A0A3M2JQI3_9CELL|nr:phosphomevalonate kinase [Cellulomonas triticagri]RMI13903.1 phosphomevalonate kinase [Cellulomonas triticagri]
MIEVCAPGKLFVAGEYAVVEAGYPAVLVAVDRHVTVRLDRAEGAGSIASDQYGRLPVVWRRDGDRVVLDHDSRPFDYVLSAIDVVERFAAEQGRTLGFYDITISSELDDSSGRKFGLGSSAAVTAATVRALDRFYDLGLPTLHLLKLALLATVQVNPMGSGGDVAASLYGGWIRYAALDRDWLRAQSGPITDLLAAEWPGLAVRRLPTPESMRLVVGWTGVPASTMRLVEAMQSRKEVTETHYPDFLAASRECVDALAEAIERDDAPAAKAEIRRARGLLTSLAREAGVDIETPALRALCETAEHVGAAAKSSGAGGGDCGIVLVDTGADLEPMLRGWALSDVRHLSLQVQAPRDAEVRP